MTSKKSRRIVLLIAILIIQIIVVNSQDVSVNPITGTLTNSEPTPTVQPISLTNHVIKVGFKDFGFSRNNFTVGEGDVLFWDWEGELEHSVIESTLETPCTKKIGGFDLGRHKAPHNASIAAEGRTYVFFSDVSDDCKKGMYGGINLPSGYEWPKDLATPPQQIVTTPLNPTPTPTPTNDLTPTGSVTAQGRGGKNTGKNTGTMTAKAEGASGTPIGPSNTSSVSGSSNLKGTNYVIITGVLMLMSYIYY